jgi:hypothetical protein
LFWIAELEQTTNMPSMEFFIIPGDYWPAHFAQRLPKRTAPVTAAPQNAARGSKVNVSVPDRQNADARFQYGYANAYQYGFPYAYSG